MKIKITPFILAALLAVGSQEHSCAMGAAVNKVKEVGQIAWSYVPSPTMKHAAKAAGFVAAATGLTTVYWYLNNPHKQRKVVVENTKSSRWDRQTILKAAAITAVTAAVLGGMYYYYQPDILGTVKGWFGNKSATQMGTSDYTGHGSELRGHFGQVLPEPDASYENMLESFRSQEAEKLFASKNPYRTVVVEDVTGGTVVEPITYRVTPNDGYALKHTPGLSVRDACQYREPVDLSGFTQDYAPEAGAFTKVSRAQQEFDAQAVTALAENTKMVSEHNAQAVNAVMEATNPVSVEPQGLEQLHHALAERERLKALAPLYKKAANEAESNNFVQSVWAHNKYQQQQQELHEQQQAWQSFTENMQGEGNRQ
jgi:hypothetical protein